VSESKVELVCSIELHLLLGKRVIRGCPFEHKLQFQRYTVRRDAKKYQFRLLSPTILYQLNTCKSKWGRLTPIISIVDTKLFTRSY
jgi:hypothetical protein